INGEDLCSASSTKETLALLQIISENIFKIDKDKIIRTASVQAEYAYIQSIEIGGKPFDSYKEVLEKIGQSSHDHNSDYTGYAKGQERFASPIYVSVLKTGDNYRPIITTLNTAFKNDNQNHGSDESVKFKKDILSGGL
ncbi:MAG: hypothetical protein ABIG42_02585, partial [bacterium]